MRGAEVKEVSLKIIDLYNAGHGYKEIMTITGQGYGAVYSCIRRAFFRGDVKNIHEKPRTLHADLAAHKMLIGALAKTIEKSMSPDIRSWLIAKAAADQYENVAEFLCDLAVEQYFEEKEK